MLIKNLGPIKSGRLNFNDLVVIWGHNNSGKTMLTYLLYAIREEFRKFKLNISEVTDNDYFSQVNNGNMVNISDAEVLKMFDNFQTYFENNSVRLMSNYFSIEKNILKTFILNLRKMKYLKYFQS
ncbi:ATP-binding protein [Lactococcus lactis]|nr:ATP-binding protein [Lactococcus lactis]